MKEAALLPLWGGRGSVPVLPADGLFTLQTSQFLPCSSEVSGSLQVLPSLLLVSTAVNAVPASPAANLPAARSAAPRWYERLNRAAKSAKRVGRALKKSQGTLPPLTRVVTSKVLAHVCNTPLRRESEKLLVRLPPVQPGWHAAGRSLHLCVPLSVSPCPRGIISSSPG